MRLWATTRVFGSTPSASARASTYLEAPGAPPLIIVGDPDTVSAQSSLTSLLPPQRRRCYWCLSRCNLSIET